MDNIDFSVQLNTGAKTSTSGKKNFGQKRVKDAHQGATQHNTKLDKIHESFSVCSKILMPKLPCNASGFLSLTIDTKRN